MSSFFFCISACLTCVYKRRLGLTLLGLQVIDHLSVGLKPYILPYDES